MTRRLPKKFSCKRGEVLSAGVSCIRRSEKPKAQRRQMDFLGQPRYLLVGFEVSIYLIHVIQFLQHFQEFHHLLLLGAPDFNR